MKVGGLYILVPIVAVWGISLWVAFWLGSENGFLLAQKGTYALEYANAQITVNFLECNASELRPTLVEYADIQTRGLKATEEALGREKTPFWRNVVNSFYKTPAILWRVSTDKSEIPPVSKVLDRLERLRTDTGPDAKCTH